MGRNVYKEAGSNEELPMMKALKELSRTLRLPFNRNSAFRRLKEHHARAHTLEETVDWAMNFGDGGYMTIMTWQIPSEICH